MFDIGLGEFGVIILVAVIVLGPERLPELARQAAQMIKRVRDFANAARDELREELGPEFADLELRDLDPRAIVRKHVMEAMDDAAEEAKPQRKGLRPLEDGETPPYDVDAT